MDFKVAGTKNGITAIQVDIKIDGLTPEIIRQAFEMTKNGRYKIIDEVILKTIPVPRKQISGYAPKIFTTNIDPEKIRDVIGPGGKMIKRIIADTGVKVDIEDDGKVYVATPDAELGASIVRVIEGLGKDIEPGQIYLGKVMRITPFGAFV